MHGLLPRDLGLADRVVGVDAVDEERDRAGDERGNECGGVPVAGTPRGDDRRGDQDAERGEHRDQVDRPRHLGETGRERDPPEEEVADRERDRDREQRVRAPLAAAEPEPDGGGGDAEVAADEERRELEAVPPDSLHRGVDAEVDRRPPRAEAAHAEAERVARVDRGDGELGEAPGDVAVVGERGDEQRQEPEEAPTGRGNERAPLVPVGEREVRRERERPEERVERPGHEDVPDEEAADHEQPPPRPAQSGEERRAEQRAQPEREEVAEVHAALEHEQW